VGELFGISANSVGAHLNRGSGNMGGAVRRDLGSCFTFCESWRGKTERDIGR
jgi:hypothetical protein